MKSVINLFLLFAAFLGDFVVLGQEFCGSFSNLSFAVSRKPMFQNTWSSVALLKSSALQPRKFVATWQSNTDSSGLGIYARLFSINFSGAVSSSKFDIPVNSRILYDQRAAVVTALSNGGFAVAFVTTIDTPSNELIPQQDRISIQIFDSNGRVVGLEFFASESTEDRLEVAVSITAIESELGGFVAAWVQQGLDSTGNILPSVVKAKSFSDDGVSRSGEIIVNSLGGTAGNTVSLSSLDNGNVIAVWDADVDSCDSSAGYIFAQEISPNGALFGPMFQINRFNSTRNSEPSVTGLRRGGFAVSWTSQGESASQIHYQVFDRSKTPLSATSMMVNQNAEVRSSGSKLVSNPNGGFMIMWVSSSASLPFAVQYQLFDEFGMPLAEAYGLDAGNTQSQTLPAGFILENNMPVITWTNGQNAILGKSFPCRQDCVVSEWSNFTNCSAECGGGEQTRFRRVLIPPQQGGQSCPLNLVETWRCNTEPCPDPLCLKCFQGFCYKLIQGNFTNDDAKTACSDSLCPGQNCLVSVDTDSEREYLINSVSNGTSVWIGSFRGETLGDNCLVMSPFGAVLIPPNGCNSSHSALCEIPSPANCVPEQLLLSMSLKPPLRYQFISAPADNTKEMTLQKLKAKVATGSNELAEVAPLPIPDFKVGTLDSLVQASDELSKVDSSVESIVKRLAENVKSLLESNEAAERARTQLLVNDRPVDAYVRNFSWNSIKYRTDKPIKEMAEVIAQEVNNIDINVRNKMATYSNVKSNIAAMERKKGGNLAVKNVSDLVKKEDFVLGSEYLQTIVLAVPKLTRDEFLKNYERLTQMVVPRSAKALVEDDDYVLYAVVVFKRVIDEFNAKAREYKCIPRDFVYDEQAIADEKKELSTAASSAKEQRNALLRLCKTNFSEAFAAWVHIKALRIFVESILRYGLPPNFQAAVLKPHKGKQDKLLSTLCQHYQKLGPSFGNGKDDNPIEENLQGLALDKEFFPFVRFELVFEE